MMLWQAREEIVGKIKAKENVSTDILEMPSVMENSALQNVI